MRSNSLSRKAGEGWGGGCGVPMLLTGPPPALGARLGIAAAGLQAAGLPTWRRDADSLTARPRVMLEETSPCLRSRTHADISPPGLLILSFDEFQSRTATWVRFGRRHSLGNKSRLAQCRYDFLADHATHFRGVDVFCQGCNSVRSLPFPSLISELPVQLTAEIREPSARVHHDPAATPLALYRLRPVDPVESVVKPPLCATDQMPCLTALCHV